MMDMHSPGDRAEAVFYMAQSCNSLGHSSCLQPRDTIAYKNKQSWPWKPNWSGHFHQ